MNSKLLKLVNTNYPDQRFTEDKELEEHRKFKIRMTNTDKCKNLRKMLYGGFWESIYYTIKHSILTLASSNYRQEKGMSCR